MLRTLRKLLELIRFSHTVFALPFALLAAVMAWGYRAELTHAYGSAIQQAYPGEDKRPSIEWFVFHHVPLPPTKGITSLAPSQLLAAIHWQEFVGILFCMVFARSAAMAFNRLADRRIDADNPRTASRHLPYGEISVRTVVGFAAACSLVFVASTTFFLPNRLPLYLSVPVLLFLMGYSYAKRFTNLSHFWLGAALALSPVAVWIAIRGEVVLFSSLDLVAPVVLGGAVLTWVAGFDIIYACQDADFDRQAKLHSIPARHGVSAALKIAAACHVLTVLFLVLMPMVYPFFGALYWTGVVGVGLLLAVEHTLVRPDDLTRVNVAFFNVNAVISFGLFAVGTLDLLVGGGQ